jgi:hypothetical protein
MSDDSQDSGFLSRWSRRKALLRRGQPVAEPAATAPAVPVTPPLSADQAPLTVPAANAEPAPGSESAPPSAPATAEPAPTMADAQQLTPESDFRRFVARGVDADVKNTALKKLFADPHFNVMDGLDTYIDDYGKPDPLPAGMLRQMVQSKFLGLFTDETDQAQPKAAAPTPLDAPTEPAAQDRPVAPPIETVPNEDADLRLQPHDAVGRAGPQPSPAPDTGRKR